ncbi:unnamed protein product [Amoebophrya sp. A25]|nr:unnamed protein product [Amoebophrya sp. A25]|eukprot:GSA25T00010978001.1
MVFTSLRLNIPLTIGDALAGFHLVPPRVEDDPIVVSRAIRAGKEQQTSAFRTQDRLKNQHTTEMVHQSENVNLVQNTPKFKNMDMIDALMLQKRANGQSSQRLLELTELVDNHQQYSMFAYGHAAAGIFMRIFDDFRCADVWGLCCAFTCCPLCWLPLDGGRRCSCLCAGCCPDYPGSKVKVVHDDCCRRQARWWALVRRGRAQSTTERSGRTDNAWLGFLAPRKWKIILQEARSSATAMMTGRAAATQTPDDIKKTAKNDGAGWDYTVVGPAVRAIDRSKRQPGQLGKALPDTTNEQHDDDLHEQATNLDDVTRFVSFRGTSQRAPVTAVETSQATKTMNGESSPSAAAVSFEKSFATTTTSAGTGSATTTTTAGPEAAGGSTSSVEQVVKSPLEVVHWDVSNKDHPTWGVLLDHRIKSWMIVLRGTMSPSDLLRDADAGFMKIDEDDPDDQYLHSGGLDAAWSILEKLEENNLLQGLDLEAGVFVQHKNKDEKGPDSLLSGSSAGARTYSENQIVKGRKVEGHEVERETSTTRYRVIVQGHSLGSLVGLPLSILLKRKYGMRHLRCLLTGPVIAAVSPRLAQLCEPFTVCYVYEDDVVSRLTVKATICAQDRMLRHMINRGAETTKFRVVCCGAKPAIEVPAFHSRKHKDADEEGLEDYDDIPNRSADESVPLFLKNSTSTQSSSSKHGPRGPPVLLYDRSLVELNHLPPKLRVDSALAGVVLHLQKSSSGTEDERYQMNVVDRAAEAGFCDELVVSFKAFADHMPSAQQIAWDTWFKNALIPALTELGMVEEVSAKMKRA